MANEKTWIYNFYCLKNWPGRIGTLYGVLLGLCFLSVVMEDRWLSADWIIMAVFIWPSSGLIGGTLGLLAGKIGTKVSQTGKQGAYIGAGVTGIWGGILSLIAYLKYGISGSSSVLWCVLLVILISAVPGFLIGALVGTIVGAVKKLGTKKER